MPTYGPTGDASHIAPAALYSFSFMFERARLKRVSRSGASAMSNSHSTGISSSMSTGLTYV